MSPDYNWFPQGKVVFVAPTKPLVAQQIDACHKTCGIPGSAAAELTGNVSTDKRTSAVSLGTCSRLSRPYYQSQSGNTNVYSMLLRKLC